MALAERQGGVFSYQDAVACGYTVTQVRRCVRGGLWRRLRRGQYTMIFPDKDAPPWEQATLNHRLAMIAAVRSLAGPVVLSHQSAVVAHGLPTWGQDLSLVHVTREDDVSGRKVAGVVQHRAQLTAGSTWLRDDLPVVTPARAIIEIACSAGLEAAVVVADEAIRTGAISERALEYALCDAESWPGSPAAKQAVAFCDGRSGSVGESRLRLLMAREGLPDPILQKPIIRNGEVIGYVDFYFEPPLDTVVEFDGKHKYTGNTTETVLHEKWREDAIREMGHQVVRVIWSDLARSRLTASRIRQAFARAQAAAIQAS